MGSATEQTSDPIPLLDNLESIYSQESLVKQAERWDGLRKRFEKEFKRSAQFIARAPGRVNLMGDHVDHMRFSCMPAALELDILMAVSVQTAAESDEEESNDGRISFHLRNTTERFEETTFESNAADAQSVELHHEGGGRWANYFKVAFKGLLPHLSKETLTSKTRPVHVNVLVDGTIPPESSLSSSAAMTSCSSIVILEAFHARRLISRREMAEVAIESERLVGVNSGGMDQAASIFGQRGNALYICFEPSLNAEPKQLPTSTPAHTLVIANTLIVSDKKVMGPVQYNLRVCELMMACRALCGKLNLPKDKSTRLLKPLTDVYFARNPIKKKECDERMSKEAKETLASLGEEAAQLVVLRDVAMKVLPSHPVTRDEAEKVTGYTGQAFDDEFLARFPVRAETFDLSKRVRHVFNESLNVLRFKAACEKQECSASADTYAELGKIMHASQRTLFDDYQNGCPELKQVCSLMESNGALGARPTGAGWGGSVVALVSQEKVNKVVEALRSEYYDKKFTGFTDEAFANAVLVSQPAQGACVYTV